MIGKDVTQIALGTKDIKVPFVLKRNLIRPIVMGLRDAILKKGEISILGFGRFYIYRKKVSVGIGKRDKKLILAVAFRPSKQFLKMVEGVWSEKQEISLVDSTSKGQPHPTDVKTEDSPLAPVVSVPEGESKDTSVETKDAGDTSSTPGTDW